MPEVLPSSLAVLLGANADTVEHAWQQFVAQHSRLILSVARSVDRNYDAGMDRYVFILEQLRRDDFHKLRAYVADPRCTFTTWLVVVCRRICIDQHRSKFGRARAGSDVIALQARRSLATSLFSSSDLQQLVSRDPQPDAYTETRETEERLERCLQALDSADRLLLQLRFEQDLGALDIMRLLDLPTPFHVYRRINRLLKDLRTALTIGPMLQPAHQKPASRPLNVSE